MRNLRFAPDAVFSCQRPTNKNKYAKDAVTPQYIVF